MPKRDMSRMTLVPGGRNGAAASRIDQLVSLVDHCTAALAIAEAQKDKFLSYMLSMTIQEARARMRASHLD